MGQPVIQVRGLGKRYRIRAQKSLAYRSLREDLWGGVQGFLKGGWQPGHWEEFWALQDVSFDVQQGDVVGIIGRNGAGKSTLLKILSRIVKPTTGEAVIRGRVGSLLEVGTGFHPELTGRENIFMNGAILGMSRTEIRAKFDEIVAFAEVEKFLDTPVKHYSSGMYVRLAFAVAAHLEPEILIVDEVLAVGDAQFQKKCLGKMGDVSKKEGKTILFVSHNMGAVVRLCSETILLMRGGVGYHGSTRKAITHYINSDLGATNFKQWSFDNFSDDKIVFFLKAKVHSKDGTIKSNFEITEEIGITIHYRVTKSGYVFTHGCNLFNDQGINILNSHDIVSSMRNVPRSQGDYSATVWIPSNFLAEGTFIIGLAILTPEPFSIHLHEPNALAFKVTDNISGSSARGEYTGEFPGLVRPILKWEASLCTKAQ
ncbi:ABC transporter ATP-binding protein [Pseudocalidococcus azoricus]|uniref:ABC transporter ATP-binding protein n=1 Tax=Pseudocalidococcus azoricus TaxID=3110322 RepID=UPI0038999F88